MKGVLRHRDDVSEMACDWKTINYNDVAKDISIEAGDTDRIYFYVKKCRLFNKYFMLCLLSKLSKQK